MDFASELLVILLSVTLIVFLVVGIVLVVYLIKLTKQIRSITDTAGRAVDHIGTAVDNVAKLSSIPYLAEQISKAVMRVVRTKPTRKVADKEDK